MRFSLLFTALLLSFSLNAQQGDCPYPVLLIHGLDGDYNSWEELYNNADFTSVWGGLADTIWTVNNAYTHTNVIGPDGVPFNADDDVLTAFSNEPNTLVAGCLYAMDMNNFWNEDPNDPQILKGGGWSVTSGESDSNESAIKKSGPAVRAAIQQILAANHPKRKVIVVGYSMGGLSAREYLQRNEGGNRNWWLYPNKADGHRVAKLFTVGTPHRGSNTAGNSSLQNGGADDRSMVPDPFSEAVRDLRYSYACGFLNLFDCPGIYLYGGDEDDLGFWYWNNDVDADGDEDSPTVEGINIDGISQFGGSADEWDGTKENPLHPLPTNVKYTYYVSNLFAVGCNPNWTQYGCGGDGVVDDERQWIYEGGDGKTDSYLDGISIPSPKDNVPYRISDRISSTNRVSHTGQQGDLAFIVRGLDEGDYPLFAHDVRRNIWYAGMAQIRPELVPKTSEPTRNNDRMIDSDWYRVKLTAGRNLRLRVRPNTDMDMRIDVYAYKPGSFSQAPGDVTEFVPRGSASLVTLDAPAVASGYHYIRITNWLNTAPDSSTAWKTAYKFRVAQVLPQLKNEPSSLFSDILLYPQPATNQLSVSFDWLGENTDLEWAIMSIEGKTMLQAQSPLLSGDNLLEIPTAHLVKGQYVLMLRTESGVEAVRFVKG